MAYGFRCANCGYQETNHYTDSDGETQSLGYKFTLETCPSFEYRTEDVKNLIQERFNDLMQKYRFKNHEVSDVDLPEGVDEKAQDMVRTYWRRRGYKDGEPPRYFSHSIWAITPYGVIDIGS